jgi:hypothetical protein
MSKYVINDDDTKSIKKSIKKFSKQDIAHFNDRLKGSFRIKSYRNYHFRDEVDIEFIGELRAIKDINEGPKWFKSEIYGQKGVSKIKVSKLIKKLIFNEVKDHAAYFGINIRYVEDIKKIKWV